jgi:phenylpyruvate tautomerase PptA (4-oxalocrotonate tautomerase family)
MGRSLEFKQEIADAICELIADGKSLRSICRQDNMPTTSTVCKWLSLVPSFAEQYTRAREMQADALADEITDIADEVTGDPQRDRLRVEARKWVASKLKPRKYGDRQLLGSDPDNPLPKQSLFDASGLSTQTLRELMAAKNAPDA